MLSAEADKAELVMINGVWDLANQKRRNILNE